MAVRKDKVQLEVEINGQKAGTTYKELIKNSRDLKRELLGLTPGTEAFIKKSAELQKVNTRLSQISQSTRGIRNGMNDISVKEGPKLLGFLKNLAIGFAAAFSVREVFQFGKRLLGLAAELDQADRKIQKVFGDAVNIVEDFAKITADSIGLTESEYKSLAATIGDILVPMGFQREEAAKISTQLVNVSGALSEWTNGQVSSAEVSSILAKALTGERESLKQLGIVIKEADVQQRVALNGMKDATGQALEQAKAQATLELILEKSRDAQAQFAQGQEAIVRSTSRIRAAFARKIDQLARGIIPLFQRAAKGIADYIAPVRRASDVTRELQFQFNAEIEALKRGELSQENRIKLIDQINTKYKEYLPNLITETTSLADLEEIQRKVNEAFQQRILLLAAEETLADITRRRIEAKAEELQLQVELSKTNARVAEEEQRFLQQARNTRIDVSDALLDEAAKREQIEKKIESNQEAQAKLNDEYNLQVEAFQALGGSLDDFLNKLNGDGGGGGDTIIDDSLKGLQELIDDLVESGDDAFNQEMLKEYGENLKTIRDYLEEQAKLRAELNAIPERDPEVDRVIAQQDFDRAVEFIEQKKFRAIEAAREASKTEEEFIDARRAIELQAQNEILEAKLATAEIGSAEYLRIQTEIADNEVEIHKAKNERIKALDEQRARELKELFLNFYNQLGQAFVDILGGNIEENKEQQLEAIQAEYDKRIELAGDDAALRKKLENELAREKEKIEKRAARDRKAVALIEGAIQGALAIIEAAPDPVKIAFAIATTITQLAVIQSKKFVKGGPTGKGIYKDSTGHRVAGVVHENEWVAPEWMTQDPDTSPVIDWLENVRRAKGGFQTGGLTTVSTTPQPSRDLSFSPVGPGASGDFSGSDEIFQQLLNEVRMLRSDVSRQNKLIRAYVVYEDIEDASAEINTIRQQASL